MLKEKQKRRDVLRGQHLLAGNTLMLSLEPVLYVIIASLDLFAYFDHRVVDRAQYCVELFVLGVYAQTGRPEERTHAYRPLIGTFDRERAALLCLSFAHTHQFVQSMISLDQWVTQWPVVVHATYLVRFVQILLNDFRIDSLKY